MHAAEPFLAARHFFTTYRAAYDLAYHGFHMTHPPTGPIETEPGTIQIDHNFRTLPGVIASYLLVGAGELTLVEAGPESTMETLLAGIRAAGFDPERITRIVVTHVHLDHAGAAGSLVRRLPHARVYVHPVGAPHLADPSKLLASAQRIYGTLMKPLWGDVLPVPRDRIVLLEDGASLVMGQRTLRALETPGHARHHLALHDVASGAVFVGDVGGVRLGGARYVRPPTPPPEFEPERWRSSIGRLRSIHPRRLYLTHFGGYDDVDWHLDDLLARLFLWIGRAGTQLDGGADPANVAEDLRTSEEAELGDVTSDPALATRYEAAGNYRMSVDGIARYVRKRREHLLAPPTPQPP
jgi:glyoxylase-like metal-dependent hydrolase (beta-lactamase superfamily II)